MTTNVTDTDPDPRQAALRRRTLTRVVTIATLGLIFDGYDLVVYGAVLPRFLKDPSQIGQVTPALGGALGSFALVGVLVGALLAGSVGDIVGRRKVMLVAYAWFAIGMGATALVSSTGAFGLLRFLTGIGVGALVGTTGALVAEFAPAGKKNLCNAITYSGVPLGSLLAALLAILLLASIGWRGMFWIGALPLFTLLPLAFFMMPDSPAWLASRGRMDEAIALAERTGMPTPTASVAGSLDAAAVMPRRERAGFAGLFGREYWFATLVLGLMSAVGLVLVYALNTWLPETTGSLAFLLVLNGGAAVGALIASRVADRFGPKLVVAASFFIGSMSISWYSVTNTIAIPEQRNA
jgi:AAHS family benzoate transporter-like MFS transporter